ncbi:MAG: glucose 1-dehydrogenase [Gammaproteobacteria bacterium]
MVDTAIPLAGKVALVTGASRGIGRAIAARLARSGAAVVINFARDERSAARLAEDITTAGGDAIAVRADVAEDGAVARLFDAALARYGHLDIVVANAGYAWLGPFADTPPAEFDRLFAVNTRGTFLCLQQAARRLDDGGRIICISTIGTILNGPGGACYFASKAAVEQFCRVLAHELGPRRITVNVVSPGFTDTDMLTATGCKEPATAAWIDGLTPLGRLGRPDEIADVVNFLAGPAGAWVNRQNLAVDGGIVSR